MELSKESSIARHKIRQMPSSILRAGMIVQLKYITTICEPDEKSLMLLMKRDPSIVTQWCFARQTDHFKTDISLMDSLAHVLCVLSGTQSPGIEWCVIMTNNSILIAAIDDDDVVCP